MKIYPKVAHSVVYIIHYIKTTLLTNLLALLIISHCCYNKCLVKCPSQLPAKRTVNICAYFLNLDHIFVVKEYQKVVISIRVQKDLFTFEEGRREVIWQKGVQEESISMCAALL